MDFEVPLTPTGHHFNRRAIEDQALLHVQGYAHC